MATTPNLGLNLNVSGHVPMQNAVKEGFEKIDAAMVTQEEIVSAGGNITIPAGSTLGAALVLILAYVDPEPAMG